MNTRPLIKRTKVNTRGEGTASLTSGAGETGCLHVEECKSTFIILNKTQVQEDQHKTAYIKSNKAESGK